MEQTMRVLGSEVRVGDVLRFRMSKYDPIRWLEVLSLTPTETGKRLSARLANNCSTLVSKIEYHQIRRKV